LPAAKTRVMSGFSYTKASVRRRIALYSRGAPASPQLKLDTRAPMAYPGAYPSYMSPGKTIELSRARLPHVKSLTKSFASFAMPLYWVRLCTVASVVDVPGTCWAFPAREPATCVPCAFGMSPSSFSPLVSTHGRYDTTLRCCQLAAG